MHKRHSLHWECGLKHREDLANGYGEVSLPSLGVWIETPYVEP